MATYLPGVTDIIPETPLFRPDFNFYNSMLQKKTAQYDQGFAKINNSYNAVLNAPLTNQSNIAVRDGYIEESKQKLDQLAGADLSLLENANAAESIFAPFWEDDLIVKDASLTRAYASETQKGLAMRDSKDEKVRAGYSETAMQYLANGKEKLANASRDPKSFDQLESRRFTPFQDIPAYFNNALKEAGYKLEYTEPDSKTGAYLVTTHGGERAKLSLQAFAEGMIGSQMQDQLRVMGTVEQEGRVKLAKQENPGFTDEQALHAVAKGFVGEYRKTLEKGLSILETEHSEVESKIKKYEGQASLNESQQAEVYRLLAQKESLESAKSAKQEEYDKVKTDDAEGAASTIEAIVSNPNHYFTSLVKNRTVTNWATAHAANSSVEWKINPAWQEYNKLAKEREDLKLNVRKQELEERKEDWNENPENPDNQPKGSTVTTNADGSVTTTTGGKSSNENGTFLGVDSTDLAKHDKYEMYQASQQRNKAVADNAVFSIEGLGNIVMKLGVDHGQMVTMFSAIKKDEDNPGYKYNSEERAASNEISKKLEAATGMKIHGPGTLRNAMIAYSKKYFEDHTKGGAPDLTGKDLESLLTYSNGMSAMQQYVANDRNFQNMIEKDLATTSDPEAKRLYVDKGNGKKGLLSSSDLAKEFDKPSYKFMVGGIPGFRSGEKSYTGAELAKLYLDGKIERNPIRGNYTINGEVATEINPSSMGVTWTNPAFGALRKIEDKYGKPERIAEILKQRKDAIIGRMPQFEGKTGQMGSIIGFDITSQRARNIANELSLPSNRDGVIYQNGAPIEDAKTVEAITQLLATNKDDLKKVFGSISNRTIGINGKRSIVLSPGLLSEADKKIEVGGKKISDLLGGGPIEIPIADNAKGAELDKLAYSNGMYIHDQILQGKSFSSDPVMEAAGYKYKIFPDSTSNPQKAYVVIERKVVDPKTGTWSNTPVKMEETIDFYGPNKKNPDQLVSYLNSLFAKHLKEGQSKQQLYQATNPKSSNKTFSEVLATYNSNK